MFFNILRKIDDNSTMILEPKDLFEKLEFDKVRELLYKECVGPIGQEQVQALAILTDHGTILRKLKRVHEMVHSVDEKDNFPMSAYPEISEEVRMLQIEGYVLPVEGLQRVNSVLLLTRRILRFFTNALQQKYPSLYQLVRNVEFDEELIKAIEQVIDENGDIRPDASPELLAIRRKTHSKQRELDRQFRTIINLYKQKGWLSDSVESFRNGRRVLSVPSEHKRKIRGIIHDESSTGRTAFIEPEGVIDINNDIFDLQQDEKREIFRILKDLSAAISPYTEHLDIYQQLIGRFDLIVAKSRLAIAMEARMPKVKPHPHFGFRRAFHPLLYLKNKAIDRETVPFDLVLLGKNRVLILSGPNAGGKSITMKTVGLQQLMLQAGMLVPVDKDSEFGIFERVFADIGDQQSLEDDLSTYSSRLKNMKTFLDLADDKSLILIDEFGSGTDPKIGGAIAEAILQELNHRKIFGVITTHYSNLKMFAFKAPGLVNGSMTFDQEGLSPTYEMKVGRPGSSYAFEIAQKSGLDKKVLKYAKHKTGKNEKAIDELLVDLQKEKKELEERLNEMTAREKQLEKLIRNYDMMQKDLEFKRKKLKLETKERNLQQTAQENKELERLVREIREEKNLEKAKEISAKVRQERKQLDESVHNLREEIYYQPSKQADKNKEIGVGDFVKLRTGGAAGQVESINKGKAIVLMGLMKMTTNVVDLQHANEPLEIQSKRSISTDVTTSKATFESKIDLRGLRREEALKTLESFVDKAIVSDATNLRIVHGKGDGVLRTAVKKKLREYKAVSSIFHPESTQGGDGVTIAELE